MPARAHHLRGGFVPASQADNAGTGPYLPGQSDDLASLLDGAARMMARALGLSIRLGTGVPFSARIMPAARPDPGMQETSAASSGTCRPATGRFRTVIALPKLK